MSSFRLLLCVLGLATYVIAKHVTAPDGELTGLPPGTALTGFGLNLPQAETNAEAMAWMNNPANIKPQLVPPSWSSTSISEDWSMLSAVARTKIQNARPTRHGASLPVVRK